MITVFHLACTIATRRPEPNVELALAGFVRGLFGAYRRGSGQRQGL